MAIIGSPTVLVDNETIGIVPNSASFTLGKGTKNVRVASAGGGATEIVVTENAEEKKSKGKFSVYPTKENIDKIVSWSKDKHVVQIIDNDGFQKTMQDAVLVTDPEIALGADTVIELEWEGKPVI